MQELVNDITQRKPIRVLYEGDDFGIYRYDEESNSYKGAVGSIDLRIVKEAVLDKDFFIQIERVKEEI